MTATREKDSAALPARIIVRPSAEMTVKSRPTRRRFQNILRANIEDAFRRIGAPLRVEPALNRMILRTTSVAEAERVLPRLFGVASYSPVTAASTSALEDIVAVGTRAFTEAVRGRRYAVRAKRLAVCGFSSQDVNQQLGAALDGPGSVDLTDPEVTVHVEIGAKEALMFAERRPGAGGLPGGTQEGVLALISGGFDSAVAAWQVMRRGAAVDYVFFNMAGAAYERMVVQVVKVLCDAWVFGHAPRLHVVDFAQPVADLKAHVRSDHQQVVLKRLMYRAASAIAYRTRAQALITGEAIGQVSSQTVSNLNSIDPATDLPVLRPLIAFDKTDIVAMARKIGTAPLSERIREYCAIGEGKPVTHSRRGRLDQEEAKLDPTLLAAAVEGRRVLDVLSLTANDLRAPYLLVDSFPEGATVIDCQPKAFYGRWHVPGAVHHELQDLLTAFRDLDKDPVYVLYCPWGTQTPMVVEMMQQAGYEAYAFRGGISAVKKAIAGDDAELLAEARELGLV